MLIRLRSLLMMDEEIRHCDQCGCELNEDDGTWVDGDLLCQECVDAYCVRCDHCDEIIWQSNAVEDDDTTLCPDCYENHYYRCECCGRIMRDRYVNWQCDLPYCDGCFEEFDNEIEQYNYKPEPQFYGSGERFFGIELEVDEGGKDDDNAKVQYSKTNKNGEPVKQYKFSCDCFTPKTVNEKYLDDMVIYGLRECIFSSVNSEELLQRLNEYSESQNQAIDLQITLLNAEKADVEKRRNNLVDVVARGESIPSIITEIGKMDAQIEKINRRITEYEASKRIFTPEDIRFIKGMFTDYVMEERNEMTLAFLEDTIDRIEIGDTIDVKLKKNIKVDRNTKKNFSE